MTDESAAQMTAPRAWSARVAWWALLAALASVPLVVDPGSPDTGVRLLHGGTAALKAGVMQLCAAVALVAWGLALARGRVALRAAPWSAALAALASWVVVATVASVAPGTALRGSWSHHEGALTVLAALTAGFLTLQLAEGPARMRRVVEVLAASAVVAALYGLVQYLGFDPLSWVRTWNERRAFATLGNPDMYGAFAVIAPFAAAGLALSAGSRTARVAWWAGAAVAAAAVAASFSRGAWVGAIAGAVALAVAVRPVTRWTRRGVVTALAVGALALAVLGASVGGPSGVDVVKRVGSALDMGDRNTAARMETWRIGAAAVAARPLTGYGPDTFALAFEPRRSVAFSAMVPPEVIQDSAHDIVVQTASDLGVPGLLVWLAALGLALAAGARTVATGPERAAPTRALMAGVIAAVVAHLVAALFAPGSVPSLMALWVLAGLLVAPSAAQRAMRPVALGWLPVAVAAALAVCATVFLVADARAFTASDRSASAPVRIEAARTARTLDPFNAEYAALSAKAQLDDVLAAARNGSTATEALAPALTSALADARATVALEPTNPRRALLLGSMLLAAGATVDARLLPEASGVLARIAREARNDPWAAYWHGRALRQSGRTAAARAEFRRALRLRPDYAAAAEALRSLDETPATAPQ